MIPFDSKTMEAISANLVKLLETGELIDVTDIRLIGKTTTLINYAKANGYNVIVMSRNFAAMLTRRFNYDKIYSVSDLRGRHIKEALVDEGVKLNSVRDAGVKIIGGYVNYRY